MAHALSMLNNLMRDRKQQLTSYLEEIQGKVAGRFAQKGGLSTQEIIILMLLHGLLKVPLPTQALTFSNQYWPLLLNVLE